MKNKSKCLCYGSDSVSQEGKKYQTSRARVNKIIVLALTTVSVDDCSWKNSPYF